MAILGRPVGAPMTQPRVTRPADASIVRAILDESADWNSALRKALYRQRELIGAPIPPRPEPRKEPTK